MKKILIALSILIVPISSNAADVTFSWLPNTDHVTGYKIYAGDKSREYTLEVDVGMGEELDGRVYATVTDIHVGAKLYYAATAYNEDGESEYSDEVIYREPWPKPHKPHDFKNWKN